MSSSIQYLLAETGDALQEEDGDALLVESSLGGTWERVAEPTGTWTPVTTE